MSNEVCMAAAHRGLVISRYAAHVNLVIDHIIAGCCMAFEMGTTKEAVYTFIAIASYSR